MKDNNLYIKTKDFLDQNLGKHEVVSGALLDNDEYIFSVGVNTHLDSACLCAEVGNICEAVKNGNKIKESICLYKKEDQVVVFPPCGLCLERFSIFGPATDFLIEENGELLYKNIKELAPSRWYEKF